MSPVRRVYVAQGDTERFAMLQQSYRSFTCLLLLFSLLAADPLAAQGSGDLAGPWTGRIEVSGVTLQIHVVFADGSGGLSAAIDIPQQGAKGLPLRAVRFEGAAVRFELPAGPGVAVFDGTLDGDLITGSFTQGLAKGTFILKRGETAPPKAPDPVETPPYPTEEVIFGHGDVSLAGTLSVPTGKGPFPAVVLISGSGPQTRDEEVAGFKIFRVLADGLTRQGIAVLRFDDRGVGGSTGGPAGATTADWADDALAGVRLLSARSEVDKARIGLVGHSEGALVAAMAAVRSPDVAFIVLMAGPGVNGEAIVRAQAEAIARASGATDADVAALRAQQDLLFKAIRTGEGWEQVVEHARAQGRSQIEALPEDQRKALGDPEQYLNRVIQQQLSGAKTPWYKYFAEYDPAPTLAKVSCPVLALFGERDLQVPLSQNRPVVERIIGAGHARSTVRTYPAANHLFQTAVTGNPAEYGTLPRAFVPGLLDDIATWIREAK